MVKLAVIRVCGKVNVRREVSETLRMLGLTRSNHCVVIDDIPSYLGMLRKAKDMLTWGEIEPEVLERLLRKRGRVVGNERLTDELFKSRTPFSSVGKFARAFHASKVKLGEVPELKKVFRLHPPRKGYGSTKRPFKDLGDLGYRGGRINELLLRMI